MKIISKKMAAELAHVPEVLHSMNRMNEAHARALAQGLTVTECREEWNEMYTSLRALEAVGIRPHVLTRFSRETGTWFRGIATANERKYWTELEAERQERRKGTEV